MIRVAPRVQDLHRDAPAGRVHGIGDLPVLADLPAERQLRCARLEPPDEIGRDAARDDEADDSSRPVCIEPISTRFGSVVNPRSSGASRCGYAVIRRRFYVTGLCVDLCRAPGFVAASARVRNVIE